MIPVVDKATRESKEIVVLGQVYSCHERLLCVKIYNRILINIARSKTTYGYNI